MKASAVLSLIAGAVSVAAQSKGFNYGSTNTDGSAKAQADFEAEFNAAKGLVGTTGFTSARLFTTIQAGTANGVTSAIPAAIASNTELLLGLWASAGEAGLQSEITALTNAVTQYGDAFTKLVVGISVGSEDLYRISPTGIINKSGVGAEPTDIVNYIGQVRDAIKGGALASKPVGHVDTWTAWVNGSNSAVAGACDFIGMDAYPYFQTTQSNGIDSGAALFSSAYQQTVAASQGKPVWVTETGWPVSGDTANLAVPSTANAKTYWDEVGCGQLFGKVNTWWFTLQDAYPTTPNPSFGVVGTKLSTTPLFDLTCSGSSSPSSSSSSSAPSSSAPASSASSAPASSAPASSAPASSAPASSAPASSYTTPAPTTSAPAGYTTTVATTGSSVSGGPGGYVVTVWETTIVTVNDCETVCPSTLSTSVAPPPSSYSATSQTLPPASSSLTSQTLPPASSSLTSQTLPPASSTTPSTPSSSSCPADLSGSYQYPHLIVPVNSQHPDQAYGTSYNGEISSDISTIFNFDIPQSYSGKTCSLVFLLPKLSDLQTSNYTFNNQGGISASQLSTPASQSTTYGSVGSTSSVGSVASVASGNSYVIASGPCAAGKTVSYEFSASGGLDLTFFEDYNPSPLGVYVVAC